MAYSPIESYGIIGDLRTIALVSVDGSIDYMCYPLFDSPTVFASLLDDENGGRFQIGPAGEASRRRQMYLPNTNVLMTRFLSEDGVGEILDFMPIGETRHGHAIVRRVRCVRGPFTFRMSCRPRFDYARAGTEIRAGDGAVTFAAERPEGFRLRLRTPVEVTVTEEAAEADFTLEAGESVDFVLEAVDDGEPSPTGEPGWVDAAFQGTVDYWREWLESSNYGGRWAEMVHRSALAMKLLASEEHGSIAAAATFGLPEEIGGERNWDYRFTWIRDGSFTAAILMQLGFHDEGRDFMRWVQQRYDDAEAKNEKGALQIMYGIDGRHDLGEEIIHSLEGYRKSGPVRIGNGAYDQLQLDIYGELLYAAEIYDRLVEPVSYDFWTDLRESVDWVCDHWEEPDEGIWEVRGGRRQFIYSRLMDWVALDRAIRIADRRALPAPVERWRKTRDAIHADIYDGFWSEKKQAFVQYKGSDTLDASTLIMPLVDFIAPRDPRWISTLNAVGEELVDDSLVYRYRPEAAASDGLAGAEGTFCMCSYWYIECLALAGRLDEARLTFEKMHGYANHLGLYAEEMDPTGRYLGNFPQAFTHLGLVRAALELDAGLDARR